MNRNAAIAIAVISILAIGGVAYYLLPAMFPLNSMTVTLYNADDEVVYSKSTPLSLWPFAYIDAAGQEVTKVVVEVNYDTAFSGAPTSVSVQCDLTWEVILNTITGSTVNGPITDPRTKTTETGTFTYTYYLSSLITPVDDTGKENGWGVLFNAKLTGSATIDGQSVAATPWNSGEIACMIDWSIPALSMVFVDATLTPTPTP